MPVPVGAGAGFCIYLYKVKDTHAMEDLHECLSTIINMVLSVQVYYYSDINIANFKGMFLYALSSFLPFILDYFQRMNFVYQICYSQYRLWEEQ